MGVCFIAGVVSILGCRAAIAIFLESKDLGRHFSLLSLQLPSTAYFRRCYIYSLVDTGLHHLPDGRNFSLLGNFVYAFAVTSCGHGRVEMWLIRFHCRCASVGGGSAFAWTEEQEGDDGDWWAGWQ